MATKYNIDESNGIVTATVGEDCTHDTVRTIKKFIASEAKPMIAIVEDCEALLMNNKYVGKAKCDPVDSFVERTGKDLALERALDKYHYDKFKKMTDFYMALTELAVEIDCYLNKHYGISVSSMMLSETCD